MVKNISLTLLISLTIVVALVASLFATNLTGFAVSGNEEDTLRVDCSDKSFKLDSSRNSEKKIAIDSVGYVFTLVSASDSSATIKVSDGTTSEQKEITEKSKKEILGIEVRVLSADESTALNRFNAKIKITKCKKPSDSGTGGGSGEGSGEGINYLDPTACEFKIATPDDNSVLYQYTSFSCNSGEVIGSITHIDCPDYGRDNRVITGTGWNENQMPSYISYSCVSQETGQWSSPTQIFGYCCKIGGAQVKSGGQIKTSSANQAGIITTN